MTIEAMQKFAYRVLEENGADICIIIVASRDNGGVTCSVGLSEDRFRSLVPDLLRKTADQDEQRMYAVKMN